MINTINPTSAVKRSAILILSAVPDVILSAVPDVILSAVPMSLLDCWAVELVLTYTRIYHLNMLLYPEKHRYFHLCNRPCFDT